MSTSERTLNQVRAILNKLDRSIDEAREKRTHPRPRPLRPAAGAGAAERADASTEQLGVRACAAAGAAAVERVVALDIVSMWRITVARAVLKLPLEVGHV